jgi:hypothetical protein
MTQSLCAFGFIFAPWRETLMVLAGGAKEDQSSQRVEHFLSFLTADHSYK